MKSIRLLLHPAIAVTAAGLLLAATPAPVLSAENDVLEIADGTFERGGQRVPATLRQVIDVLAERFPEANIVLAGTGDIVVDNVMFRWGRGAKLDLRGVLDALSLACGSQFIVSRSAEGTFVLSPARVRESLRPRRTVAIFGLGKFLEERIRTEAELSQVHAVLRDVEARIQAGLSSEKSALEVHRQQLMLLQRRLDQLPKSADDAVERISELARTTLGLLRGGDASAAQRETPLEFQFDKKSNLLVVIGGDEALEVVGQIVAAITGQPQPAPRRLYQAASADSIDALAGLTAARADLAALAERYTERHPSMVEQRRRIEELEKQLAELQSAQRGSGDERR